MKGVKIVTELEPVNMYYKAEVRGEEQGISIGVALLACSINSVTAEQPQTGATASCVASRLVNQLVTIRSRFR
jgi:hypothetical protein